MSNFHHCVVGLPTLCAVAPQGRIQFSNRFQRTTWSETDEDPNAPRPRKQKRVLVAEDDPATQMILRSMLEQSGFAVTAVADGEKAVAALNDAEFDVVLLDIQMPGMDGIEVARHLRAASSRVANLPVIAVTSETAEESIDKMLAAGFDGVMGKPVRRDDLIRVILAALNSKQSGKANDRQSRRGAA